jgi:hypothetical protein
MAGNGGEGPLNVPSEIAARTTHGNNRDANDTKDMRHGREVHVGYPVGAYIQSPPILFTRDGHNIWMGDMYRGASCFLILSGPSFAKVDHSLIRKPGILTMSVNNSSYTFRTNLWTCVDDPTHFIRSIWLDPLITKLIPFSHVEKPIFNSDTWELMQTKVGDCPNTFFYRRNESFCPEKFLFEDTVNWGNHGDEGGGRSVMLAAIRLLFYIGVRKIFLLGCDFKMSKEYTYHFKQGRADGSVGGNMKTFALLVQRFTALKPIFDTCGLQIFNCNPESGLRVFPMIDVKDAVEMALGEMPRDLAAERTDGLYERTAKDKKKEKKDADRAAKAKSGATDDAGRIAEEIAKNYTDEQRRQLKQKLDDDRAALNVAKSHVAEHMLKKPADTVDKETSDAWFKNLIALKEDEDRTRATFKASEKEKNRAWGIVKN